MNVPEKKKTQLGLYVTAIEAYPWVIEKNAELLFVDIRTHSEITFVGMPTVVDAHIPYKEIEDWQKWDVAAKTYELTINNNFVVALAQRLEAKGLHKQSPIILMCRSGIRSAEATNTLATVGYTQVYSLLDGFEGDSIDSGPLKGQRLINGWKNSNLPWSYELDAKKMYDFSPK